MGKIDSGSKSSRLLASRRYTHNTLTTAQESFTNVLDLQASEIYTQASKIPSSGLPYSGSSQNASYYTVGSDNILKYWYRQKLTKSNTNNEVWFFLDPSGSDSGIGAQLINDNQEVNFVSPKYSTAALATSTTEDSTPGYLAVLYKSTSASSGSLSGDDIVSTNDYQFDYKTGVVQFMNAEVDPTNSHYVFMTVYQYVGKTLATGVEISGDISGSVSSTGSFGYLNVDGDAVIGGNLTFGDADTDSVSFSAEVNSNIIPDANTTYDLGSSSKNWRQLSITHVTASGNISGSVTSTGSFGRAEINDDVSIGGDILLDEDQRIYFEADKQTWMEANGANLVRIVTNNSQMLLLDHQTGNRAVFGNGTKVFIGANNNELPSNELEVVGTISGSGILSIDGNITGSGNLEIAGNISGSVTSTGSLGYLNVDGQAIVSGMANSNLVNVSSSFSTRVSNLKTDSGSFSTRVSNLKTDSGSFSTRVSNLKSDSGSFSTRVTNNSSSLATRIANVTSSISTRISNTSSSLSTRVTTNTLSGSILAGTGNIQGLGTTNSPTFADIVATGRITAEEFHTEFVSASINFSSGSTKFGDTSDDIHDFSGSLRVTGSGNHHLIGGNFGVGTMSPTDKLHVVGNIFTTGNISGSVTSTGSFGTLTVIDGVTTTLSPIAPDGAALGTGTNMWSDLYLAEGAAINFNNGGITLTETSDVLVQAGGNLRVPRLEIDSANDYLDVSTDLQIISAADITLNPGGNNVKPGGDSQDDLGVSGTAWRALYVDAIEMNDQGAIAGVTHITSSGNISASGDIAGSSLDINGTGNVQGVMTLQDNLFVTGNMISGSTALWVGNQSSYISGSTGNLKITGNIVGVNHVTASGTISASGDFYADGRIYEQGTSVVDHATAMAIVFGG